MKITIASHEVLYNGPVEPAFARVYCDQQFVNDDGQTVLAGAVGSPNFVKEVAVTVVSGVPAIAAFSGSDQIDSSVDENGGTLSNYSLSLHDANGNYLTTLYTNLRVPPTPTSTTWRAIVTFNQAHPQASRHEYYDTLQTNALLGELRDDIDVLGNNSVLLTGNQTVAGVKTFTSSPIVPAPTTDLQVATKKYVDDNTGASATAGYALRITPSAGGIYGGNNVNHGYVHPRGTLKTKFWYEAWTIPLSGAAYWWSDGHGGSHDFLGGWDGNPDFLRVSGNFWNHAGGVVVSFSSIDRVPAGTLHHTGVGWDQSFIKVYLDGVLTDVVAYSGNRGNVGGSEDGMGYAGGSDHSNDNGWIFRIRFFENLIPMPGGLPPGYFNPEQIFRASFSDGVTTIPASFNADYTKPASLIVDSSSGYNGSTHPGVLSVGNDYANFVEGLKRFPSGLPTFDLMPFEQSPYAGAAPSATPPGAALFEEFRRLEIVPAWINVTSPPANTAPTGQTWSTNTGIIGEKAYCLANSSDVIYINPGVGPNMDVTYTNGNTAQKLSYIFRRTDANNYLQIQTELQLGLYNINLVNVTAGVPVVEAVATGVLSNENFSDLRIVANGTNVKVYVDGPLKFDNTTARTTGNDIAVNMSPLSRVDKVVVYPVP